MARSCPFPTVVCRLLVVAVLLGGLGSSLWAAETEEAADRTNPYLPRDGLSAEELVRFIERMQRKPETIRRRPGFGEAVLYAADRVLDKEQGGTLQQTALLIKLDMLHQAAVFGNAASDDQLFDLASTFQKDQRQAVAEAVAFYLLERRAAEAGDGTLPAEKLAPLLVELKAFFAKQQLAERHLRLASYTVRVINLLPEDAREEHFQQFGGLIAKSSERKLADYGKRIAKSKKSSDLVGKELDLAGTTVEGDDFDWKSYRGKVVLVDFWATWCGPCRAELPNVKQNYEKYHAQGFEIVGISLDNDRQALEEFLAEQDIPWTNLYDDLSNGWQNPIAQQYGIKAIPATILVGKDGKVVTTSARGAELGRQLARLLGEE